MPNPHCNAILHSTGKQCQAYATNGSTKCHKHGGSSLRGVAHPNYKHGRDSKFVLPINMRGKVEAARHDDKLLSLSDNAALIVGRINVLLERVETGESGSMWDALDGWRTKLLYANKTHNTVAQAEAINEMNSLIARGQSDSAIWAEIMGLVGKHSQISVMERKAQADAGQMITITQAVTAMQMLLEATLENVKKLNLDPKAERAFIDAIQRDFFRITGVPEREPATSSSTGPGTAIQRT